MPEPLDLSQIQIPIPGSQQTPPPEPNPQSDNPIHESFIANVSDEHKDIVKRYIPDWDKLVTQQFQQIHEEYKPYKDLGADPEMLQSALQILKFADADPVGFYSYVKEQLLEAGLELPDMEPNGANGEINNLPEYEGVPPEVVEKITKLESSFDKFSKFVDDFNAERETQSNQQKLDTLLKELHTTHGDFDEPAILGRIMQGMNPEDAVKDYKSKVTQARNSPPPPPSITNGGTYLDQVDRSKIRDEKTRKSIVADALTAALQGER